MIREITAIFRPSFLEISLSGLSTLSIRMTLMNSMLKELKMIEISENIIIMKSMMFHETLRYESSPLNRRPYTMILMTLSQMKKAVITMSTVFSTCESAPSGSFKGLSIAIVTVDMKMIDRMKPSKYHLFKKVCRPLRNEFWGPRMNREVP